MSFRRLFLVLTAPAICAVAIACTGSAPDLTPSADAAPGDDASTDVDPAARDADTADATDGAAAVDGGSGELLHDTSFTSCDDLYWKQNGVLVTPSTESAVDGGTACRVCSNQVSTYSIYQLVRVDRLAAGTYEASVRVKAPKDATASRSMEVGLYYDDGTPTGGGDYGSHYPIDLTSDWTTGTVALTYEGADAGFLEVRIASQYADNGACFLVDQASLKKKD